MGQLGHGDFQARETPQRIKNLIDKQVTAIGLGFDFCVALGQTLPTAEIVKL
jgi:Regulator of chromosome condensation (RCC1) repeat